MSVEKVPEHLKLDEAALQAYMIKVIPDFRDAKDKLVIKKFSHGQSNPTYLLKLADK
jgi:aminoglycoside phosphotransferase (APT) family kinase protein